MNVAKYFLFSYLLCNLIVEISSTGDNNGQKNDKDTELSGEKLKRDWNSLLGLIQTFFEQQNELLKLKTEKMEEKMSDFNSRLNQINTIKENFRNLEQKHTNDLNEMDKLDQKLNNIVKRLEKLEQNHADDAKKLQTLEEKHEDDVTRLETLEQEHSDDIKKMKTLDQKQANLTKKLETLGQKQSSDVKMLEMLRQKHASDIKKLETLGQKHASDVKRFATEIENLKGKQIPDVAFHARVNPSYVDINPDQTILFKSVITNLGNGFNPNTGIFQAPVSGTYVFSCTIMSKYALELGLQLNNVYKMLMYPYSGNQGLTYDTSTNSIILRLKKGDQVRMTKHMAFGKRPFEIHNIWSTFSGFLIHA